jgi:hypothetical protein
MTFEWNCMLESEASSVLTTFSWDDNTTIEIPPSNANYTPPAVSSGGCFGTGAGKLLFTSDRLVLSTNLLYTKNTTYRIGVRVSKDTRTAEASIFVQTISGFMPLGVMIG